MNKKVPEYLHKEAILLLERISILKGTVIWHEEQVDKFMKEYSDEKMEALSWEEKEKVYSKANELIGRMNVSVRELDKLNGEYNNLRGRANEYFGREVMPSIDVRIDTSSLEEGEGEEWIGEK